MTTGSVRRLRPVRALVLAVLAVALVTAGLRSDDPDLHQGLWWSGAVGVCALVLHVLHVRHPSRLALGSASWCAAVLAWLLFLAVLLTVNSH